MRLRKRCQSTAIQPSPTSTRPIAFAEACVGDQCRTVIGCEMEIHRSSIKIVDLMTQSVAVWGQSVPKAPTRRFMTHFSCVIERVTRVGCWCTSRVDDLMTQTVPFLPAPVAFCRATDSPGGIRTDWRSPTFHGVLSFRGAGTVPLKVVST